MSYPVAATKRVGDLKFEIVYDQFSGDPPQKDWDQFTTFITWDRNYEHGSEDWFAGFEDYLEGGAVIRNLYFANYGSGGVNISTGDYVSRYASDHVCTEDECGDYEYNGCDDKLIDPLEHSSEWVGYVYIDPKRAREVFGAPTDDEARAKWPEIIDQDVETYRQWANGEVYGVAVFHTMEGEGYEYQSTLAIGSLWGIYVKDWDDPYFNEVAVDMIPSSVSDVTAEQIKEAEWIWS